MSSIVSSQGEASVRPGDIIGGKYQISRLIGRGGMGVVVEAWHVELAERVAIKVLHPKYLDNTEAVQRFHQEARAAVQIRGEHSVRLHDVGVLDATGSPYIVMELLDGQDLAGVIERGQVEVSLAILYILQACEGMAEVHAHGIVHRDLKPGNLFLTKKPDQSPLIKVLDFGIAKGVSAIDDPRAHALTQTLVSMGTPLYMSPEQIRSSRTVDARADVWSLGTILYELIAGRPAFGGNTVTHITAQVLEKDPPSLDEIAPVPRELANVIGKALAKDPDARYIDVAAFAQALEPFAGPAGVGFAGRAAAILRGATRPEILFSSPVVRDDDLGGTRRFDRRRRARLLQLVVAALAVCTLGLGYAAIDASRGASASALSPLRSGVLARALVVATTVRVASEVQRKEAAPPVYLTVAPSSSSSAGPADTATERTPPAGTLPKGKLPTAAAKSASPTDTPHPPKNDNPFLERN